MMYPARWRCRKIAETPDSQISGQSELPPKSLSAGSGTWLWPHVLRQRNLQLDFRQLFSGNAVLAHHHIVAGVIANFLQSGNHLGFGQMGELNLAGVLFQPVHGSPDFSARGIRRNDAVPGIKCR